MTVKIYYYPFPHLDREPVSDEVISPPVYNYKLNDANMNVAFTYNDQYHGTVADNTSTFHFILEMDR